ISFTPGTTFDLKSRGGRKEERAVIYRLLREGFPALDTPLFNLFQCNASTQGWDWTVRASRDPLDSAIQRRYAELVRTDPELMEEMASLCECFARSRNRIPIDEIERQLAMIGRLRHLLAQICVESLEPDLV